MGGRPIERMQTWLQLVFGADQEDLVWEKSRRLQSSLNFGFGAGIATQGIQDDAHAWFSSPVGLPKGRLDLIKRKLD
jgi:hypothetical protein